MLGQEEKDHLREQEAYRKAIRDELSPARPQSSRDRVLAFLNSNVGMWLLSAVLVSGLGTLYTRHQTQADEARKHKESELLESRRVSELRDRLNVEISFRLSTALIRLNEIERVQVSMAAADRKKAMERALAPLALPASDVSPPLYPEFKAFSGIALIAELRRHAPDGEKKLLKRILADASGLFGETYSEHRAEPRTAHALAGLLLAKMRNPQWEDTFHFTDCPEQRPFC